MGVTAAAAEVTREAAEGVARVAPVAELGAAEEDLEDWAGRPMLRVDLV